MTYVDPDSGVEVNLPDEDESLVVTEEESEDDVDENSPDEPNIDESTDTNVV